MNETMIKDKVRFIVWGTLAALVVAAVVSAAAVNWDYMPMEHCSRKCLFCGRERDEEWRLGLKILDRVTETDCSRWVDAQCSSPCQHVWSLRCFENRSEWYGGTETGGNLTVGDAGCIYRTRDLLGEQQARQVLKQYHGILTADPSKESRRAFYQKRVLPLITDDLAATH